MKLAWIKYLPVVLGIMLFIGCKNNNNGKADTFNSNPAFQSDPKLKKITDEIISSPKDASLYFSRGNILRKMQMDSLALKDYKMATTLDSSKSEYYSAVGDLLFENKDISGSVQWIQKAVALNPTDSKAHLKMGKMFLYVKNYPQAFHEINVVMEKDPHNPETYFLKGMVYKDLKDTAKAISNFLTAVQESPDYHDAMMQLGLMYSAKKDPVALRYFDNAFKLDSTDLSPIFGKGVFYQYSNDVVAAKEEYKKCIMKNNHFADAYFNMGYLLMQEDSTQKAWRQYNIVTKIDPTNPAGYYNRGLCSEIMDSVKNAIADYKMALTLDSSYASPREALARLRKKGE